MESSSSVPAPPLIGIKADTDRSMVPFLTERWASPSMWMYQAVTRQHPRCSNIRPLQRLDTAHVARSQTVARNYDPLVKSIRIRSGLFWVSGAALTSDSVDERRRSGGHSEAGRSRISQTASTRRLLILTHIENGYRYATREQSVGPAMAENCCYDSERSTALS